LEKRGHSVDIIDLSTVPLNNFEAHSFITKLCEYDIVYYRSGLPTDLIITLEGFLNINKVKTINLHFIKHPFINSKTYGNLVVNSINLKTPNSLFNYPDDFATVVKTIGLPFVIKPNDGARGENIHLINTADELQTVVENNPDLDFLYQSFIPHHGDYRVHTVGGKVVAMYSRTPKDGDFRCNVSQGGCMVSVEEKYIDKLTELASKVAALFDFEIMAVDFMLHSETDEFYFTEINLNPGWEISDDIATGVDLSAVTVDYFEKICND